jgi:SAM-dependent methyltransferase
MRTPGHWVDDNFFHEGEYGLERCLDCSLIFTNPRPTENHLDAYYSRPGYSPHETGAQDTSAVRHLLRRIDFYQPGLRSEGRFLDYGCGGGTLLAAATQTFSHVNGFDLSPEAVKSCRATGIQATTNPLEIPAPIDAMLLCQCLEHVSDFDGLFQTIRRILRPGSGRIFIAVPNARGLRAVLSPHVLTRLAGANERYTAFPIHLSHFTRKSLKRLFSGQGFRCLAMETYAFGIDSYFRSSDREAVPRLSRANSCPEGNIWKARRGFKRDLKQAIKTGYNRAGLGENLLGIFGFE